MSTEFRTPHGPPWDVDDVADVHAGVFPAEVTADLLTRIRSDPDGAAVLTALDSTVDDLSLLPPLLMPEKYVLRMETALFAERRTAAATRPIARERLGALLAPGVGGGGSQDGRRPVPHLPTPRPQTIGGHGAPRPMATRQAPTVPPRHQPVIPAFLPGGPPPSTPPPAAPVHDLAEARGRAATSSATPASRPAASGPSGPARLGSLEAQRRKRRRWTTGVLAAAAVAGIGVITAVALNQPSSSDGVAGAPAAVAPTPAVTVPGDVSSGSGALQLDLDNLAPALPSIEGQSPGGNLAGLAQFGECLKLNAINPDDVTGATKVTYSGGQAVAIVVKDATDSSKVRVVVVGTTCGTDGATAQLADRTVTR
ncbi:hypothetical protein ABLG96_21590 [Nakamurella sp. A5-74]|uniref:Uncharacterized protein n=1 Tax=Nakamurella sp. A5-74 TaxID=3158264 RepID=A0AAU8DP27_9ACTN